MIQFKECASCAVKSGSPMLCAACLHNRATINRLLTTLRMAVDAWETSTCVPGDQQKIDALRKELGL